MSVDYDRIHKPIRKLRKLLKRFPKNPSFDEVHDLRSNIRRIEVILAALSLDSKATGGRLLKDLAGYESEAARFAMQMCSPGSRPIVILRGRKIAA